MFLIIQDDRWSDVQQKIIALTEINLNENHGLFYCSPNFFLPIKSFKNIKISLKSKGFCSFKEENIMTCIGFLGRIMKNSNVKYKVKINDIIEVIGSSGIKLLKLAKLDANELAN